MFESVFDCFKCIESPLALQCLMQILVFQTFVLVLTQLASFHCYKLSNCGGLSAHVLPIS